MRCNLPHFPTRVPSTHDMERKHTKGLKVLHENSITRTGGGTGSGWVLAVAVVAPLRSPCCFLGYLLDSGSLHIHLQPSRPFVVVSATFVYWEWNNFYPTATATATSTADDQNCEVLFSMGFLCSHLAEDVELCDSGTFDRSSPYPGE